MSPEQHHPKGSPDKDSFLLDAPRRGAVRAVDICLQILEDEKPKIGYSKRLSSSRFAARELKRLLIVNDVPPLITIDRFSEKMVYYANLNSYNKDLFWYAYEFALLVDDMLS